MKSFMIAVLLIVTLVSVSCETPSFKVGDIESFTKVATSANSTLYVANLNDPDAYDWPVFLLDLHGSRWQMGYDYGYLLGQRVQNMYWDFLEVMIGSSFEDEVIEYVLGPVLDWQWTTYLSQELPSEFLEELAGMEVGGHDVGVDDLSLLVTRVIVMANAPGDLQDWLFVLINEFKSSEGLKKKVEPNAGMQCSMFGVWGSRTNNSDLFTGRNLDWNKDTGIARYKMVTVYHPEGKYSHATCGFAGLAGSLAGMSSQGITTHEANLETNIETFAGFPWVLRLRYIMENAKDISEAQALWETTNNTVGFNHMVGSGNDLKAMVMETMAGYTAYFEDNDPREQKATYNNSGQIEQIGFPLPEAVWRTNHGYDPVIREHFQWSQAPTSWSMERYMFFHNGFQYYQENDIKMTAYDAINMTSILGDKGHHAYQCLNNTDGSNVLSVTFQPAQGQMWVAWENGHNITWRPASCNTYVHFDMNQWW